MSIPVVTAARERNDPDEPLHPPIALSMGPLEDDMRHYLKWKLEKPKRST